MKTVVHNGVTLAKLIKPEDWTGNLSFFSENEDYIQVGAWQYDKGKKLLAHIHNEFSRTVQRTCETLYIVSGRIHASIYSLEEELVDEFDVAAGDILILLNSGHGYEILEDNTRVLEVKNGPYFGAENDRRRIERQ